MKLSEISKAAYSQSEHDELVARKKRAQHFAQVSGTLGLSALATRVPQGVKAATRRSARLRDLPSVKRVVTLEPKATNASNTLTALGAGIGAAGSFNFAGLQRREVKADQQKVAKSLPVGTKFSRYATKNKGRSMKSLRAELVRHENEVADWGFMQGHAHGRQDGAWYTHETLKGRAMNPNSRWEFDTPSTPLVDDYIEMAERQKRKAQLYKVPTDEKVMRAARRVRNRSLVGGAVSGAAAGGTTTYAADHRKGAGRGSVRKADDRFLRNYRDRISPNAEKGYNHLRYGRDAAVGNALSSGLLAGVSGASAATVGGVVPGKKGKIAAGSLAALAALQGTDAVRQGRKAYRWNSKMNTNIKARAYERERQGLYGRNRGLEPTDPTSRAKVDKAAFPVSRLMRKPSLRRGGLVRLASGRTVTRRGSLPGTGDFTR